MKPFLNVCPKRTDVYKRQAIRAVTRAAIYNGLQVKGIYRGYKGLVTGEIKEFKSQNVSNIIDVYKRQ